jgi:glycosyltransferase involved in cell wall biosynthesis
MTLHKQSCSGNPRVSLIIPTLNSTRSLRACLQAVKKQDVQHGPFEIIIADAGSSDGTVAIAQELGVTRIVSNPLKTGEAGKTAGIKQATGDIIALVDSDNILDDPEWLNRMLAPFSDPEIVATEPIRYERRDGDSPLTRYFSMLGMNDPICLFLGNYDRECMITGKWTGLDVEQEDCGDYLKLTLSEDRLPTIGANGFVFRRLLLEHVDWDPYFFDIDIVHQAVKAGFRHVAKVKCGIVHLYCDNLRDFASKQDRRINDFLFFAASKQRTYPWKKRQRRGIIRFCLYTLFVFPLIIQMIKGWRRKHDPAWLYHVPVCWITLWIYGKAALARAIGIKPKQKSRDGWQDR